MKMPKKLKCVLKVLHRINDKKFVDDIIELGKTPMNLKIKSLGEKNPGRLVYICQTAGCDGLFAEIRFLLHEIFFAEELGLLPAVLIPENSFYHEAHKINGTDNPFEYYFEMPYGLSVEEAKQSRYVVEHNYVQRNYIQSCFDMNNGYIPSEEYMKKMGDIVKRDLRLNAPTREKLYGDIKSLLGDKKTLAVHVRGADFKRHYKNHPNMVTVDEYLETAKNEFAKGDFEQIFLATDDLEAIEKFKQTFADKVVFYSDVIRTDGDQTVMKSTVDRENHHYNLGLEVIRDVYTLSECDGIIAGLSNVSLFARILKISRDTEFSYMNYMSKGIKS